MRLIFLFLIMFTAASVNAAPSIISYRVADHEDKTRIVFDIEDAVEHKVFILQKPDRLVVDIPNVKWALKKGEEPKALGKVITKIRRGVPKEHTLRIVFDLASKVKISKSFIMIPSKEVRHHRLVLDIIPLGKISSKPANIKKAKSPPIIAKKIEDIIEKEELSNNSKTEPLLEKETIESFIEKSEPEKFEIEKFEIEKARPEKPKEVIEIKPIKKPGKTKESKAIKTTIVIDAGHGGIDPGAISINGIHEKHITLEYSNELKRLLEETGKYSVIMTRSKDEFIPLKKRVQKARKARADLFISLHADSHNDPNLKGLSVYTLSEKASDKEAERLAEHQNRENLGKVKFAKKHKEAAQILIEMTRRGTKNASAEFAQDLVSEIGSEAELLGKAHRFAGFTVLSSVDVPSVLVELGYMSSPKEEELLKTEEYRTKLTTAMFKAIEKYFKRHPQNTAE